MVLIRYQHFQEVGDFWFLSPYFRVGKIVSKWHCPRLMIYFFSCPVKVSTMICTDKVAKIVLQFVTAKSRCAVCQIRQFYWKYFLSFSIISIYWIVWSFLGFFPGNPGTTGTSIFCRFCPLMSIFRIFHPSFSVMSILSDSEKPFSLVFCRLLTDFRRYL